MSKHKRNRPDHTPLSGPGPEDDEKLRQLRGDRPADDQGTGIFSAQEVDDLGQLTDTDTYLGELEAGVNDDLPDDLEQLDLMTELELRAGETDHGITASDEGLSYVPPIDPPTVPSDDPKDSEVASGFGVSSLDEPYDPDSTLDQLPAEGQLEALVRKAIRADSATSAYADTVVIGVRHGVVTLRGIVDDLDDSDNLAAVAAHVEGVAEIVDQLRVRALERGGE